MAEKKFNFESRFEAICPKKHGDQNKCDFFVIKQQK